VSDATPRSRLRGIGDRIRLLWQPRTLALLSAGGLVFSFLSVLYGIVDVAGDPATLVALATAAFVVATLLARVLRVGFAVVITLFALAVGMALYVSSLPYDPAIGAMLDSNVQLLTGQSLLQIEQAAVWALSVAPGPVFATWYLALRRWYVGAAALGGTTLGYFVLTGDAGVPVTLLGVISTIGLVGFGDLTGTDRGTASTEPDAGVDQARRTLLMELGGIVVAAQTINVVPSGGGGPISLDIAGSGGGGDGPTLEASLVNADSQLDVGGDIELSPEVRFRVTSAEARYWRIGSYDRYTGDGWIRTGASGSYDGRQNSPPGATRAVEQEYRVESSLNVMPAAWRPVAVGSDVADRTLVTAAGGLEPSEPFEAGDTYRVQSAVVQASPEDLASAGTDYPGELRETYTQLPSSTPERVTERTGRLTARAENPYETALAIEQWLENNREYSLEVDKPDGNVADAFLFEMERGYCTYFATTMVAMLRTQDIPARAVAGYTPGQQVDDEWVVRGLNSHVWVEVYFPDVGWVRFDPTPATPREDAEQQRLTDARIEGRDDVDTNESADAAETPTPVNASSATNSSATNNTTDASPQTQTPFADQLGSAGRRDTDDGFELPGVPSREQLALGAVVMAGAVAGLRQTGLDRRLSWWVRFRRGRQADPVSDIERAFGQLEFLLEQRHRERREGETVRAYLNAIDADGRARRVATIRERARYSGTATDPMADEAVELVQELRADDDAATDAQNR
jgi:transglutaminase-like putative cysteine protease